MNSSEINKSNEIVIYGTQWCGDCYRAKKVLNEAKISYKYIDIDNDIKAKEYIKMINPNGYEAIPVIIFPDQSILIEPSTLELVLKIANTNLKI